MNPVLRAVLQAAAESTGASRGWLVVLKGDELEVVDAVGEGTDRLSGAVVPSAEGTAGFVVGSGQPVAMTSRAGDQRLVEGLLARLASPPAAILSVPCCTDDGVAGALELVDKAGGESFTFDDVELASLLSGIAAAAIVAELDSPTAPDPRQLAGELGRLSERDPVRYAAIATALAALLAGA